jgi:ABC-type glycerol-3-phosphate transport system permease component
MSGRSVLPATAVGWFKAAAIVLLIVWSLGPIVWIVMTSLKTRLDIIAAPPTFFFVPNLDAYARAFGTNGIVTQLQNSIVVSLATTAASLALSVLAAYAFSRYRFPGRTVLMVGLLAARIFPPVAAVVPLYMTASDLRLVDTLWILIVIYTALNIPFAVWLLKTYIDTVPREIEESAVVEGAGLLRTIFRITLPLIAPGVMATAVFVFVLAWNEFMFAYMFTAIDARTVPVVLSAARGDEIIFWQDLAAQATLLILPTIVLGFLMQRYLVRGLSAGAVK